MTLQELYDEYDHDTEIELALVDSEGNFHYIGVSASHYTVYDDDECQNVLVLDKW